MCPVMADQGEALSALFEDAEDFYERPKPYTHREYQLLCGTRLNVRLVGHNPLWVVAKLALGGAQSLVSVEYGGAGHHLWQAAIVVSRYLEFQRNLVDHQTVLELGAGAGLPSLVAAHCGAKKVVATDYPDPELVDNIQYNINHCPLAASPSLGADDNSPHQTIVAHGYSWGSSEDTLLKNLSTGTRSAESKVRFNTLILADLLFNHTCHESLFRTIESTLAQPPTAARALVFFTPYRPWLLDKDLGFFDLVKRDGRFEVRRVDTRNTEELLPLHRCKHEAPDGNLKSVWADLGVTYVGAGEWQMDKVMFERDRGDERLRRTVFGFEITWKT